MPDWSTLPELKKDDYKPLYIQLSDILTEYVRTHGLSAGTALPSESELMERYQVSRTTVRQAMQRLETGGVADKVQGKGTFVCPPKRRDVFRGFQNLEEALAEQGIEVSNLLLESVEGPLPPWAGDLMVDPGSYVRIIKRLKSADGKPLAIELRALPLPVAALLRAEDLAEKPIFDLLDGHTDSRILQVTYSITAAAASEQEAQELEIFPGTPVIIRMGVYYNRRQQPVMCSKLIFPADRVDLRFEFHRDDDNWGVIKVSKSALRN